MIITKTTSYYSFPCQIGFHRVLSNTSHNSYKSNPFIFSTKKKDRRAEGREEFLVNGSKASVWEDEKVLKTDGSDGYRAM